ncbi:MAG: hypothetical protein BGO69_09010 [Bacteroidetes bacterium 46-16]|nr:MAG: hypothetical protein BGO69_09010 [Bacteroidetes bacterium 46-16]
MVGAIAISTNHANGQELFVFTEPASNMPAKSIGIRIGNWIMEDQRNSSINYHLIPELMWGVNRRLMIHVEGFASNRNKSFSAEGGALYVKYRFFSKDRVYRHFRMAALGRIAVNNSDIHQDEIETNGHNSGFEGGIIATQLLHKQAISATISYEQATNNAGGNEFPQLQANKAINYALSTGRLVLPKDYTDYGQMNLNVMVELLGQYLPENRKTYLDATVSMQFIFNSQFRVDVGYKRELYNNMLRTAPNGFLIRIEHLLFNTFK